MTMETKALAIIKAWHDILHKKQPSEGIHITKDWDVNTLTVGTPDGFHYHFGQMNNEAEDGFKILINELYNHYCNKGN